MINEQIIRDNLDKILNRREFSQAAPNNTVTDAINRLLESIWEWIKQLFQRYRPQRDIQFDAKAFGDELTGTIKFILILAGAVLLFFIIRYIVIRAYLPMKRKKSKFPEPHDYLEKPDEVLEKIRLFIEQREYKEALCFIFVAILLELNKKKIIRVEKWKTNRAYIREIGRNAHELLVSMREVTVIFNGCCYGARDVDETVVSTWYDFLFKLRETEI